MKKSIGFFNTVVGLNSQPNEFSDCLLLGHNLTATKDGQVIIGNREFKIGDPIDEQMLEDIKNIIRWVATYQLKGE